MKVSKILQKLRIDNELSQEDVAKKLSISVGKVGHHETGRSKVSIEMLKQYSDIYSVPTSYFYDEEETPNYIDDLIKRLLDEKIITDVNSISPRVVDMIMNAVKLEISMNMFKK